MIENGIHTRPVATAADPATLVRSHLRRAERLASVAVANATPRKFARQYAASYSRCLQAANVNAAQESRKRLFGLDGIDALSTQSRALREMERGAQALVLQALLDLHLEILHGVWTLAGSTAPLMRRLDRAHERTLGKAGRWLSQWHMAYVLVACRNEVVLHGEAASSSAQRERAIRGLLSEEVARNPRVHVIEHLAYLAGVALAVHETPHLPTNETTR